MYQARNLAFKVNIIIIIIIDIYIAHIAEASQALEKQKEEIEMT